MSHTYIKNDENDTYTIGTWQRNTQGHDGFNKMFVVPDLRAAIMAVNYLNGGLQPGEITEHWCSLIIKEY